LINPSIFHRACMERLGFKLDFNGWFSLWDLLVSTLFYRRPLHLHLHSPNAPWSGKSYSSLTHCVLLSGYFFLQSTM
jgi:hypothetical protein